MVKYKIFLKVFNKEIDKKKNDLNENKKSEENISDYISIKISI